MEEIEILAVLAERLRQLREQQVLHLYCKSIINIILPLTNLIYVV